MKRVSVLYFCLIVQFVIISISHVAHAGCSISGYEFWPKGHKDTNGYDYNESGAPAYTDSTSGNFDVVVYNVDGFPKCIGGNSNDDFKSLLAELESADYNIVLMQEVFSKTKHGYLRDEGRISKAAYPYRSKHWRGTRTSYGDGLVRLSDFPFDMDSRDDDDYSLATNEFEEYNKCNGDLTDNNPDCMTEKGFSVAVHEITEGFNVHVYNTHMDAGSDNADVNAREAQFEQLATFINTYSSEAVVIVGGDFNTKWDDHSKAEDHKAIWEAFIETTGIRLACQDLITGDDDSIANCDYAYRASTDQIGYINRDAVFTLTLESYGELDNFIELSDHEPTRASFSWVKNN